MSAGLSGAFAARGVGARRRGHDPGRQPGRVGAGAARLLAHGRGRAAVQHPAAPRTTSSYAPRSRPRRSASATSSCSASCPTGSLHDLADVADSLDEDLPQQPPAEIAGLAPEDPALIVFTSGTTGEPRAALHPQRYLPGQRAQAEHWLGAEPGELVWCTTATGWSKSARNVFLAPWLCGAAAMIVDGRFEPPSASS